MRFSVKSICQLQSDQAKQTSRQDQMGLEIEYTGDDGRKYGSLAEMLQAEGSKLIDDTMTEVQRAIEAQRCPVHGGGPSATMTRSGDRISFEIEGCCDDLVERAQKAGEEALA